MRVLLVSVGLSITWALPAHAEDPPANVAFADLSLGVLGVAYERALLDNVSVQVAAQFYRPWYVSDHVWGVGGQLRANFFLFGRAPEGLYLSPGARFYYATLDTADAPEGTAASWGLTLGYSFMAWETLVLRLGVGPQVHVVDLVGGTQDPDFIGAYPIVDIFAGYAF